MTKKLISFLTVLLLVLSLTACSEKAQTPAPQENKAFTPISILAGALAEYEKDDVVFNVSLDMVVNLKESSDFLQTILCVPADRMEHITGAATMMHMNQNSFTGAALELAEGVDAAAFAKALQEAIMQNQWFCGFPEKLMTATVGERFVVIAYGLDNESAPLISTFRDHLLDAHGKETVNIRSLDAFQ